MTLMSMEPQDLLTNYENGDKAKPISRAWWLDGALDCGNGRIEVARIRAKSVTMRYPAKHELLPGVLAPNRYQSSPNYTGDWVTYMLGLTEEELRAHGICPGIYQCPGIVDGSRPASNRSDRPVSKRQHQQDMAWLQNDCIGCPEDY